MIDIKNLSKQFIGKNGAPISALHSLTTQFHDGAITAILGLNGAGKSTLMRIIYGLLTPTEGDVRIGDYSIASQADLARRTMGCLADDTGLYTRLTARENIDYFARLHGLKHANFAPYCDELIHLLGMQTIAERRCEGFSLGERMKTALARAIVHKPQHILLDEPTNGLDVLTTRAVRRLLMQLRDEGRCILFSSHLMHEVEHLCDRIVVLHKGVVIADGNRAYLQDLTAQSNLEDAYVALIERQDLTQC
ncbi:MAG TPA: ATP-binding cassette domain-containing protein [Cellvibrionaceae bacterium]|nr:ATP-binding cassette domain-containing protein [Cellvibrionaceae bacterium]